MPILPGGILRFEDRSAYKNKIEGVVSKPAFETAPFFCEWSMKIVV
jgi:hypothetical protein